MSPIKTTAIVLNSINWKDSSKIITLYTREVGKIGVIAKGVRKLKSNYGGILESLNLVEVIIHVSPKRQIQVLGTASLEESYPQIKKNLEKTSYSYAILELILILIETGSSDPVFFDFIVTLLNEIERSEKQKIIFCFFLLKISSYLGFRPDFNVCLICEKSLEDLDTDFSFHKGGFICKQCHQISTVEWQIPSRVRSELADIQHLNYKSISNSQLRIKEKFNYIEFLLAYLRFHTDERLDLNAFKFLK